MPVRVLVLGRVIVPAVMTSPSSATLNLLVGLAPDKRSRSLKPEVSFAAVPVIKDPVVNWALLTLKKLVLVVLPLIFTWPVPSGARVILPLVPVAVTRERAGDEI